MAPEREVSFVTGGHPAGVPLHAVRHRETYRPDIDGLRGIAVLAVLGFHAFPAWAPGGFVGVDVFFVISGYLISTLIFEGVEAGRFDYRDFYARRIRRIFPALALVLVASMAFGALNAFPHDFRQLGKQAFGGAAFVSNLLFARGEGYFQPGTQTQPLLHLWSLGVEEQFYILWPVAAVLASSRTRTFPWAIAALVLASLCTGIVLSSRNANAAFFLPFSRFWELLLGATFAWITMHRPDKLSGAMRALGGSDVASIAGIGLIIGAMLLFSKDAPFPGWRALVPTLGTALLIASGTRSSVNAALLSWRPIVGVGLISYPLYLWHWPILSFATMVHGELGAIERIAALAAAIGLAWATYTFVEKPIRFGRFRASAVAPLSMVIAAIAVAGLGMRYGLITNAAYSDRIAFVDAFENVEPRFRYIDSHGIPASYRFDCDFYDYHADRPKERIPASCYESDKPRSIMIWGDSFAQSLYAGLRDHLPDDVGILQVATSGCRPSLADMFPDPFDACNRSNRFARRVVAKKRPDLVVLAQRENHARSDWAAMSDALLAAGAKRVLLVGPLPLWAPDLNQIIARKYWDHPPQRVLEGLVPAQFEADRELKARQSASGNFELASPLERLCDAQGCLAYVGPDRVDGLVTFDTGHLTRAGSEWVGRFVLAPAVMQALGRPAPARRPLPAEGTPSYRTINRISSGAHR